MATANASKFTPLMMPSWPSPRPLIELAGKQSPLYKEPNEDTLPLQQCTEGMRREDPIAVPQLAIPVAVVIKIYDMANTTVATP